MSKLSVRPDNTTAPPLRPTAFPIPNLANFKLSSSSSQSKPSSAQDHSNLKFVTKPQTLPNLFQYNDRSRLVFSSDEERQQPQQRQQTIFKKKSQGHLQEIQTEYYKQKESVEKQEEKMSDSERVQSPKFNIETESKKNFIFDFPEEKTEKKQDKKVEIVEEELFISKNYRVGKKGGKDNASSKERQIIETTIKEERQESNTKKKQNKGPGSSLEEDTINVHRGRISKQVEPRKQEKQEQKLITSRQQSVSKIQYEEEMSKTDAILERIQIEQKGVIVPSESEKQLEPISQSAVLLMTPRRKRNKIFEHSSKRDHSYLSASQKKTNLYKQVQTQSRYALKTGEEFQTSRIERTPQVKALNILDKLVDQIGNQSFCSKSRHYCEDDLYSSRIFASLSEFCQLCFEETSKLQTLTDVSLIGEPNFYTRIQAIHKKVLVWRQKISTSIVNIPFSNSVQYEIIKKFERLSEVIELSLNVSVKYRQTCERLGVIQNKLQEYVKVMQQKDSKRLYILIKDLNNEIDRLKQLKAGCGKSKIQNMFGEYLGNEIILLEEVKQDLQ